MSVRQTEHALQLQ